MSQMLAAAWVTHHSLESRGRFQDGNHVAEDASEGKEENETPRDEACQQETDEHGFGRC